MKNKEEPKQPTFKNWEPLKEINNTPTFDGFLELVKKLSKEYPNDMEFGKNVRKLLNSKVL